MGKKADKKAARLAREEARQKEIYESLPLLPKDAYFDEEDMLRLKDGRYLDDGFYRTEDDGELLYEGIFLRYGFSNEEPPEVVSLTTLETSHET